MINWDEKPEWADRVVVSPNTDSYYWASCKKLKDIITGALCDSTYHINSEWQTIWPPSVSVSITDPTYGHEKQMRYQDEFGDDWIDECARTFSPEEFRGAMKFTIGKYIRRLGKKDGLVKEVNKIEDYAQRWASYERSLAE